MNDAPLTAAATHEWAIDRARVIDGCVALVDVATPTGFERATAKRAVELLADRGCEGHLDSIDADSANAWARIPARGPQAGTGPSILLYSPLDTVTTGGDDDLPHVGDSIEGHLLPAAQVDGDLVVGLGAQNPKGHAAAILEAAAVLADSKLDLPGDVIIGFGAGGMPTNPLDHDSRADTGHGVGVAHLLDALSATGLAPDAAIVAKSGWFVQHEEVGVAWIDVIVEGTHTYVGARHRLPYRNAVADAARAVLALEKHFGSASFGSPEGTLEPQAMVASLHSGWERMAAFLPVAGHLRCDVRLLPGETAADALAVVEGVLGTVREADPGFTASAEIALEIPGTRTDSDHWICQAVRSAWEAIEGRAHPTPSALSGSTDANILRSAGIPTARIGLPKVHVDGHELGFAEGMNTVDATSMATLADLLVRAVLHRQMGQA